MHSGPYRFEDFTLDPADRQLTRDGNPVELNGRYFDALALLVREQGRLVSKDRFLEEVWRGVPVTDEALTQCVRTLRRQLGDDAGRPRFIETVPKHGYRFIAPVEAIGGEPGAVGRVGPADRSSAFRGAALLAAGGTVGGGIAGFVGGLIYGFAGASQPLQPGMGAVSVLLVLMSLTILVALIGGAGVASGIAAAELAPTRRWHWPVLGGALGGLIVGAAVKFLGLDAFDLLLGRSPGDITGPFEGVVIGAAVGLAAGFGRRWSGRGSLRRAAAVAALICGAAGALLALLGGRMMAGSLDLLAKSFPDSRLRLDHIGALFGERGFGPVSQAVTAALEGALFGACVVAAMILARRSGGAR